MATHSLHVVQRYSAKVCSIVDHEQFIEQVVRTHHLALHPGDTNHDERQLGQQKESCFAYITWKLRTNIAGAQHGSRLFSTKSISAGRHEALLRLKAFLDTPTAQSTKPIPLTANAVKSLYRSARHHKQLKELSQEQFSRLIALFGSLSVSSAGATHAREGEDRATIAFGGKGIDDVLVMNQAAIGREHWAFVLLVAQDKTRAKHPYSDSDHFWLMKAALKDVKKLAKMDTSQGQFIAEPVGMHMLKMVDK